MNGSQFTITFKDGVAIPGNTIAVKVQNKSDATKFSTLTLNLKPSVNSNDMDNGGVCWYYNGLLMTFNGNRDKWTTNCPSGWSPLKQSDYERFINGVSQDEFIQKGVFANSTTYHLDRRSDSTGNSRYYYMKDFAINGAPTTAFLPNGVRRCVRTPIQ
ncbi:MAG: hypothetical protein LUD46_13870 [Parabacteroides sp.]|nr:hypothetical protein [Parabacteroides sp.]